MSERETHTRIVLFDGVCNLCNGFVRFVIARDPRRRFRFAALQSATGRRLALEFPEELGDLETMALYDGTTLLTRSTAALHVVRGLTWPWPLLAAFLAVPRPLRDWVYRLVVRNRYRWFGKRDECLVPTRDLLERFVDAPDPPGVESTAGSTTNRTPGT
jgi:predicted DCC family thiol-disulfide oxidoreductase YuxK